MRKNILAFPLLLCLLHTGCRSKDSYAIRDFNASLQPHLVKVVEKGIVGFDENTRYIQNKATDEELKKLAQCEHPVLRAAAFRAMLERPSFNPFEVLMEHLCDTAIVTTDEGEWGYGYKTVSDHIIESSQWKTVNEKKQTIERVLTRHHYLRAAYLISEKIDPAEKYYPFIRLMAQREDRHYYELECALLAMAKFKKREDILFLKEKLLLHDWKMGDPSFRLLKEFPHTEYIEVMQKFYRWRFKQALWDKPYQAIEFIKCAATYRDERIAQMLDTIYSYTPLFSCEIDSSWIRQELVYAIWNNKSEAFSTLRKKWNLATGIMKKERLNCRWRASRPGAMMDYGFSGGNRNLLRDGYHCHPRKILFLQR